MNSFVPSEVVARFRATSRKLLRPKLTFSARIVSNRTSAFHGLSPRTPWRHSSRSSEASAARDGGPRNRPNRYKSSRADCEHSWPFVASHRSIKWRGALVCERMQCVRCGAIFEGRFCPRCGAPAMDAATGAPAPQAAPMGWPCPRCGTLFRGNFCPRCGLPTAAWAYRPPAAPSGGRTVLSILWTIALVGFIIFVITDFAALVAAPAYVVPGIQTIGSGQTVNSGFDFDAGNWTFDPLGTGAVGTYRGAGGNPGGFLEMSLPISGARGYWWQAFRVGGSVPFTGAVHLDIEIAGGLTSGRLVVAVDSANSPPDPRIAIGLVDFTGTTSWTAMPRFLADDRLTDPGVYYLKIAFFADSATNPVSVGFDNVRLAWTTDAAVVVYLPSPAPFVLFFTQDKTLFISYFAFLAAVIFLAAGYHLIRERREAWNAFRAPLEAIGTRLKSRSAWIALGQVWMAVTFFQVVFYYLVIAAGINPSSPVNPTPQSAWFWLYELLNAGVYEEFAFRILLIGLPMAIGSVVLRIIEVNRGGTGSGPGAAGRHIGGAWRYLIGGGRPRGSPEGTVRAAGGLPLAAPPVLRRQATAPPGPRARYFSSWRPPVAAPPDPGQPPPAAQMWRVTPSVGPPAVAVRNASRIPREYTPSYVPPPYGYPPVRFQCPYCAWVEAKYDAGRFTCTRCGRTA